MNEPGYYNIELKKNINTKEYNYGKKYIGGENYTIVEYKMKEIDSKIQKTKYFDALIEAAARGFNSKSIRRR